MADRKCTWCGSTNNLKAEEAFDDPSTTLYPFWCLDCQQGFEHSTNVRARGSPHGVSVSAEDDNDDIPELIPALVTSDGVEIADGMRVYTIDGAWGTVHLNAFAPQGWFEVVYNDGSRPFLDGRRVASISIEIDGRTPYEFDVDHQLPGEDEA